MFDNLQDIAEQNFNAALDEHLKECNPEAGLCVLCANEACPHHDNYEE